MLGGFFLSVVLYLIHVCEMISPGRELGLVQDSVYKVFV